MIAIPVLRGRVAPVLNWCSRMLIFPAASQGGKAEEFCAPELTPWERLLVIHGKGVRTLICGALSPDLHVRATRLGLKIIPGVAGDIEQVLEAYRQARLDQPQFWVPGCRRARRYPGVMCRENHPATSEEKGGETSMPAQRGGRGRGQGQNAPGGKCRRGGGARSGMPDQCICPACGAQAPHEPGIPCLQVHCPQCGKPMVRG